MRARLLRALTETPNEAADDVLLEALSLGAPHEQPPVLDALIARRTTRGLGGVIERFDALGDELQPIKCILILTRGSPESFQPSHY
jgi:hypothetical protein